MANYPYTSNTPLANQNPSDTQPDIQQNFASINSIIDEDHVGFKQNNGGFHNQTRMLEQANIPSGTVNNSVTTYVKETSTGGSPVSQEYKTLETGGNEYQTTTLIDGSFATFGTATAPPADPSLGLDSIYGWTYLPGGLILQYGRAQLNPSGNTTPIVFPIQFSSLANLYSITFASQTSSTSQSNSRTGTIKLAPNATGFEYLRGNDNNTYLYWNVIGKY